MKNILHECGFDSELSIIALKETDIEIIEKTVNEKKWILEGSIDYNKCLTTGEQFFFKPGHRALILSLPEKFEQYLQSSYDKSEEELKSELTKKLMNYLRKKNYSVHFNNNNLTDFEKNSCRVKCPFCGKRLLCSFKTHWIVSNFEAHLREHIKAASNIKNASENVSESLGESLENSRENRLTNDRINYTVVSASATNSNQTTLHTTPSTTTLATTSRTTLTTANVLGQIKDILFK